jgi:hypothetical protein
MGHKASCPDDLHTTATARTAVEPDITSVNIRSNVWLTLLPCYVTLSQVKTFSLKKVEVQVWGHKSEEH